MKTLVSSLTLMILATMTINTSATAQKSEPVTWPNFRGINCSGIASPDQDPPVTFGPDKNVLWKISLPGGHSSPCIWGDRIYISGYQEEGKLLEMLCIDRKSGKIKWQNSITVDAFEKFHPESNPATATPATDGERVYFYFCSFIDQ